VLVWLVASSLEYTSALSALSDSEDCTSLLRASTLLAKSCAADVL
jgi:hypothetical protein